MRRWNQSGEKSVQSDSKGVPAVPLSCHWGAQTCPRELISKEEFGDDGDEMAQWVAGFRSCQAGASVRIPKLTQPLTSLVSRSKPAPWPRLIFLE